MKKPAHPQPVSEERIRGLLERYACPMPFHEVRTRFLGNIASPALQVSPMNEVERLWNGDLPEFETMEAANELLGALVMGLWNQLARHQERSAPFRLTRPTTAATPEGVKSLARTRRQELEGFVEGFFGPDDSADVPERAHRGLTALSEIRAVLVAVECGSGQATAIGTFDDPAAMLRGLHEMTKLAEHEMHAVVLSCTRARKQMLAGIAIEKPTLH